MDYFWNGIPVMRLHEVQASEQGINRAGVVPFWMPTQGAVEYLLMTPPHTPGRTPPLPQIAKGGRLAKISGQWRDLDDRNVQIEGLELEPMIDAAMREGKEEVGLLQENMLRIYDVGPVHFMSQKKHIPASMYLFAVRVRSKEGFASVASGSTHWMTLDVFIREGREDHRAIVEKIAMAVEKHEP